MNRTLRRYHHRQERADDELKISRIVAKAEEQTTTFHGSAGGDNQRLRGIPAIGRGVVGGIDPLRALIDKEELAS